jgi:hypothetical protein
VTEPKARGDGSLRGNRRTRMVLAWKPNLRDEPETEVEVTFTAVEAGTRVALERRGWDLLAERADRAAEGYRTG